MDHVGSKTRSLSQILEKKNKKTRVCSRDKIFGLLLMKLKSFCIDEIVYMFGNVSC